ncbi:MAG: hypothetical protein GC178_05380 [Flavobacteriales bacterium]|nr:hypothetical protein [Flavobacteriales bacterium]
MNMVLCGKIFAQQDSTQTKPKRKFKDIVQIYGYIKNLNIVSLSSNPLIGNSNENFIHNRINLRIYPVKGLTVGAEFRNRFFYAGRTATTPALKQNVGSDAGLIDMSWNIGNDVNPFLLNCTADRLWVAYGNDKIDLRVGRQRINWGINTAWNPNDIFNAYSFVNFDYEERPGSDAVRFQYFGKNMSGFEVAVAPRKDWKQSTAAIMYKFNAKQYDFQFIAGQYRTDLTAGFGFAGNAGNAGLKGEIQWFGPYQGFTDSTHTVTGSVSADYSFSNSLYINGAVLFNSNGIDNSDPTKLAKFFSGTALTAKTLMPTKYNAFLMMSYPITPLLGSSFAVIYGYGPNLLLLNPGLTYSLAANCEILLAGQLFFTEFPEVKDGTLTSSYQNISNSVFLRLKYSY